MDPFWVGTLIGVIAGWILFAIPVTAVAAIIWTRNAAPHPDDRPRLHATQPEPEPDPPAEAPPPPRRAPGRAA